MSRFYISGVNERGSKFKKGGRSVLHTHIRGWNKGIEVYAYVNDQGLDCIDIYRTGGTNDPAKVGSLIGHVVDRKSAGPRNPKGQLK